MFAELWMFLGTDFALLAASDEPFESCILITKSNDWTFLSGIDPVNGHRVQQAGVEPHHAEGQAGSIRDAIEVDLVVAQRLGQVTHISCILNRVIPAEIYSLFDQALIAGLEIRFPIS